MSVSDHSPSPSSASAHGGVNDVAVFLDFDGTLVDLADRPELVTVPPRLVDGLTRLERRLEGALAIVTGRPSEVVDGFLAPFRPALAAAHGTERRRADGREIEPPNDIAMGAARIHARLHPLALNHPALVLEQKRGAVALHYRQAPDLEELCRFSMGEAIEAIDGFVVVEGKMVFEARPSGVDKGVATAAFMRETPFRGRTPVFIGDDTTDEDGFAAVAEFGGFGVKVGEGTTVAPYRIAGTGAVRDLLDALATPELTIEQLKTRLTPTTPGEPR